MDDSLKVWSPGRLASGITLPELFTSHASVLRNKGIAQVLYDIGWIERWGGGILKMCRASAEAGIPGPVFQEDQGFSVIFRKDVFDRDYLVRAGLSERLISAVLYAKENGKITNADYQRLADVSAATARRDLKNLVDKNILEMKGVRKGIYYVLKYRS
jgi:ATP-dependent DNA helicase RecG